MGIRRKLPVGVLALSLTLFGGSAFADVYTFTGSDAAGVWNDAANWTSTGGGLPGAGDSVTNTTQQDMTDFDGQSVGAINAPGKVFRLSDNGTLTMNNNGSTATINAAIFNLGTSTTSPTLAFTDDLTITMNSGKELALYGTIRGPGTLTLGGSASYLKSFAGSIQVPLLDVSGFGYIKLYNAGGASFSGTTIDLGAATYFLKGGTSYSGLNGANLEMDSAFALFHGNSAETINVGTWKVGSTFLPAGTYNAGSGVVDGIDMATVFAQSNVNVSVATSSVPEPASLSLLALAGAGLLMRRRTLG